MSSPKLATNGGDVSARQAAALIAAGKMSSEQLVQACLERIALRDSTVKAWSYVDPEEALAQARARDKEKPLGPLHGVPIAIKDVIDVASMPTGMGSPIYDGYRPFGDASCVSTLRAAGAVILGKTVTAEFAGIAAGATRHPLAPEHTPGGSSSGSAAAVADRMVPLALGTQTGGSVIRPAAFCGVVGFKPTFGTISRTGLKLSAESFDTIGFMARDVLDIKLLWEVFTGCAKKQSQEAFGQPKLQLFRGPNWINATDDTKLAIEQVAASLRARGWVIEELATPDNFVALAEARKVINDYERARALSWEYINYESQISPEMLGVLNNGRAISYEEYVAAIRLAEKWRVWFGSAMDGWDGILTPSADGEAPLYSNLTGSAKFQEMWSLLHMPAITLPTSQGRSGLPVGVQLVGHRYGDNELLDLAQKLLVGS